MRTKAITEEAIMTKIYIIRGHKVMIDIDLALLYQVETKRLKESVKRNIKRFPSDFMFRLSRKEFPNLRSQIATSSWGGQRYLPMVFTEQGVAMLSSILNSPKCPCWSGDQQGHLVAIAFVGRRCWSPDQQLSTIIIETP